MKTGNCFRCGQAGHWISDCHLKFKPDDPPPPIHCPCGGGFCEIKVSKTPENPRRKFYTCPAAQGCKFFKWCDKVTDEDITFRPAFIIPICPCGAGPCRRVTADSGKPYFICCIKKGFGACGFFQWEDVNMLPSCDAKDDIDFWVEADQIVSDMESSFQARGMLGNANQVVLKKECQASLKAELDSIVENLDAMPISDIQSAGFIQERVENLSKALLSDQQRNGVLSKLSVDESTSDLVRDTMSSGSVVYHETRSQERAETGEAEGSVPDLHDLIEQYNSEKLQLENISEKHVQVLSAFMGCYRRLRLLLKETSHLSKLLLETEKEMACCEAETLKFGVHCREVAKEMAESQKRMQKIAKKVGDRSRSVEAKRACF